MKKLATIGVFLLLALPFTIAHADSLPDGCSTGDNYSATTGHPCTLPDCAPGDLFSAVDGHRCGGLAYLPGCFSTAGYSTTTGTKCDGSTPATAPITTNPTNTVNTPTQPTDTSNNNTGATSPAPTQPVDNTPAPLTQDQINNIASNAAAKLVRTKYPDAAFSTTWTMSNGQPGTFMQVSSTDTTPVLEFWNDNGKLVLHWIDTTLGSN